MGLKVRFVRRKGWGASAARGRAHCISRGAPGSRLLTWQQLAAPLRTLRRTDASTQDSGWRTVVSHKVDKGLHGGHPKVVKGLHGGPQSGKGLQGLGQSTGVGRRKHDETGISTA